ncbi:HD domain-containing protein [Pararhizobium qamdonense]|uniref:HD domain-containing protein n=1 Tax=Pararhizobium qamdonense TaxID=3031126 RepID=UPI0023E1CB2D|nr:HD domain-containing protein [Pararhizobium qamdonense]
MTVYSTYGVAQIAKAEAFATAAHEAINQRRNYSGEPYIVHPRSVAAFVGALPDHTWQQVVLAWLHDTVEDTGVTLQTIRTLFGPEIADGMYFLTNVEKSAGNRMKRHELNVERLKKAPGRVQTVKLADIYDNTKNIAELAPSFAPVFLREKVDVMGVLLRADKTLWSMTMDQIERQQKEIRLEA